MKLCKDCKNIDRSFFGLSLSRCKASVGTSCIGAEPDYVTGKEHLAFCAAMRINVCGPEGELFEAADAMHVRGEVMNCSSDEGLKP